MPAFPKYENSLISIIYYSFDMTSVINSIEGDSNMSTNQMMSKIETLLYGEKIMQDAKEKAEALRDEIKQEMLNRNTEELTVGQYIIRWTSVLSQRFDATAFKKVMPDIYKAYLKQVSSRRFTIA